MTFSRGLKYCSSYTICIFSSALCAVQASVVFQVCEHHCRVNESFRKHPSANNTCWGSSLVNMSHPLSAFSPTPTTDGNRCLCTKTHKRLFFFFWCKNCHPYALGIHVRGKINASIVSLIAFVDSCFKVAWRKLRRQPQMCWLSCRGVLSASWWTREGGLWVEGGGSLSSLTQ